MTDWDYPTDIKAADKMQLTTIIFPVEEPAPRFHPQINQQHFPY